MRTLSEVENAILQLSQVECDRLSEWLGKIRQHRLRVFEPAAKYRSDQQYPMTVEEYLELEASSRIRHEYLAGEVFAMSGATPRHNRLAGRVYEALRAHLRGGPCEPYMGDVQVKLRISRDDYLFYPDVMVVCGREQGNERFFTDPKLIVEVLSPSTAGIDRHEKRIAYRRIASLEEYVIVAQESIEVTSHRRTEDWEPAVLDGLESILDLRCVGLSLPLAQIYEGEVMAEEGDR